MVSDADSYLEVGMRKYPTFLPSLGRCYSYLWFPSSMTHGLDKYLHQYNWVKQYLGWTDCFGWYS